MINMKPETSEFLYDTRSFIVISFDWKLKMGTLPAVGLQFINIRSAFTCFEGLFNSKSMPLFNYDHLMYYYLAGPQHFFIQAYGVITLDFISVIKYQLPAEIFESTYTCFHLASCSDCKTALQN